MSLPIDNKSSATRPTGVLVKRLASSLLLGAGLVAGTAANASELTDQRGYERCVGAFASAELSAGLTGVTYPRTYYISHQADSKTYYVNAKAWDRGVRVDKRLTCETSASGRELRSVAADNGSYARAPRQGITVAER